MAELQACVAIPDSCGAETKHGASLHGDDGAAEGQWPEIYPNCGGERQSPIDIQRRKVHFNSSLKPLLMTNYDEDLDLPMTNNGHTVQITLPNTMHLTDSDGTVYATVQMHCHWGSTNSEISGSEHTIDGIRSMMEVHIVHYNLRYGSYEEAKDKDDGLAVVAVLVKVKKYDENTYYSPFISGLSRIKYPGQNTTLKNINIRNMMPEDIGQYYTYKGSLTTPPCTENVKWFIFSHYVFLSIVQADTIENSVVDHNNNTIQNNYRRTQPLNNRVVEANFPSSPDECCKNPVHVKNQQETFGKAKNVWKVRRIKKVY